ncbi:hypothetical protein H6P81_007986 [Aristolochia fimbriata]|uniref:Cyclic nucleotide-binding domain-containing protein n=1 Tax=Aristolochia fimbriata TaxID=158543 RepID=A0AAV7F520_ARIFI|nr:hypothetical protein H6P81_007986 [Aristolochia fimbriata]
MEEEAMMSNEEEEVGNGGNGGDIFQVIESEADSSEEMITPLLVESDANTRMDIFSISSCKSWPKELKSKESVLDDAVFTRYVNWIWSGSRYSGLLCMALSSCTYFLMEVLLDIFSVESIPLLEVVFTRSTISLALSFFWLRVTGQPVSGTPHILRLLGARAILGYLSLLGFVYSIQYLPLSTAIVLNFISPLVASIAARVILQEKLKFADLGGLLCSFLGLFLIYKPLGIQGTTTDVFTLRKGHQNLALLVGLFSSATGGISYCLIRAGAKASDQPMLTLFAFGVLASPASAILLFALQDFVLPSLSTFFRMTLLGVFAFFAEVLLARGFQLEKTSKVANIKFIEVFLMQIFGHYSFIYLVLSLTSRLFEEGASNALLLGLRTGSLLHYMGGHREKFVRLDDLDSRASFSPDATGINRCGFSIEGPGHGPKSSIPSKSFKRGMRKGSERLKSFGRSLGFGVSKAVFAEDLKVSEKKIFNPQDKFLQIWNRLFVISCILAVSIDPLFFFLPIVDNSSKCLGIDWKLAVTSTTLRTVIDAFYVIRMFLQFRTAYIAPSSRVFGRGELVIDPTQIAKRYLRRFFIIDLLAVLPLPQIVVWRFLQRSKASDILATKNALLFIILTQYVPRFLRIIPLMSELKRTAGVFAETTWAGAAYYLLWYMLASHIVGAFWYLLGVERVDACWNSVCKDSVGCNTNYLYCGDEHFEGYDAWNNTVVDGACSAEDDASFNFGIYAQALTSKIIEPGNFLSKYSYCLWWGLQNLSTLGQGLSTSIYPGEVIFSITLAILGLILFALLIGNMQTYLSSLTIRLEEMRVKRRDSEQWMHHRLLPPDLRERVRRYDQYKWLETRGVDEESLVQSLPKDLRRDIKRHLCLALVRRVPLFENMDDRLLDAICERLKPSLCTEHTYIVREGDPVDEMIFIIRGRLESVTTDGGRTGFFNLGLLKEGDFCGEELLTWALDPKSGSSLPSSTRTVKALTEVEAFALTAEELKFVASQFRRLHSRAVQHTFRFYSQQWRTWAACFIQAAWRRYLKRKYAEMQRREEEEEEEDQEDQEEQDQEEEKEEQMGDVNELGGGSPSLGATIYASRFAANALKSINRTRSSKSSLLLLKPPEPDFTAEDEQ